MPTSSHFLSLQLLRCLVCHGWQQVYTVLVLA
uniref:Uncharacterized protein n=1 Tax=Ciona intestinalis TaxID=7719 RepID=H2XQ67_CIOIN